MHALSAPPSRLTPQCGPTFAPRSARDADVSFDDKLMKNKLQVRIETRLCNDDGKAEGC